MLPLSPSSLPTVHSRAILDEQQNASNLHMMTRPQRARRSESRSWIWTTPCCSTARAYLALVLFATIIANAHAEAMFGPHVYEAKPWTGDALTDILFDRSEPPRVPEIPHLKARDTTGSTSLPSSIAAPTSTAINEPSGTITQTISTATDAIQSALPIPFDGNVGANFSSPSCETFFQNLSEDTAFLACHPLSLLLQTSSSYFSTSQSLTQLTRLLDASCDVDFASCSNIMSNYARQIKQSSNCQSDAALGNPIVNQAFNGFNAYEPLYRAGCLPSQTSGGYCFADAVTNSSAPTAAYVYYLPLGVNLPAGTRPPCDTCLQDTMAIFQNAARNQNSPLSSTYGPAAQMIDIGCGPSFVAASVTNASSRSHPIGPLLISVISLFTVMVASILL